MKTFARLALALTVILALAGPAAAAVDPKKTADIKKLLVLTGSGNLGKQVATALIGQFKTQFPNAPAGFWESFADEIKADELIALLVPVYERNISHEDIKAIIKFYESPAGKRFAAKQPQITQESMAVGQKWGQELGARVMQKLNEANSKK
jgi:hypothetical protein